MFLERLTLPLLAVGLMAGCTASEVTPQPTGADGGINQPSDGGGVNNPSDSGVDVPPAFAKSERLNLRFKRDIRLRNDVAQTLGIDPADVCTELGQYHCTDFVHTVSLGGVEPYTLGLTEAFANTTVTTPIATERVVLFACERRADADLAGGAAQVIFRDLDVAADGKLQDVDADAVASSIDTLYKRALLRPPTATEVDHLRQLYRDIEADNQPNPARDWAILSCFSVLSSMESLFY